METLRWEYEPKLKYITQESIRPPTFVAFTDSKGQLHFSAERFLVNRLREEFNFEGTPVVVKPQRAAIVKVANRPSKAASRPVKKSRPKKKK
jgi:GTP-binding protein